MIYILIKLNCRFLSYYISFDYTSSLVNFSQPHYGLERFGKLKIVLFKAFKYPTSLIKKSYLSAKRKFHFLFCKTRKRPNRSLWRRAVPAVSKINDVDSPSHTGRNVGFVCRVKPSRAKSSHGDPRRRYDPRFLPRTSALCKSHAHMHAETNRTSTCHHSVSSASTIIPFGRHDHVGLPRAASYPRFPDSSSPPPLETDDF